MELIKVENDKKMLTSGALEEARQIKMLEAELKARKELFSEKLCKEMGKKGLLGISTDNVSVSYTAPHKKETFDSEKFREEHSDLYDEYVKFSPVKASIRITVKK